jgi:serine/threonine protein phosphatase 1
VPWISKFVPWIDPFLKQRASTPAPSERRVPDGMRVYCVGDIHGRDDLLQQMVERVEADIEVPSFEHAVTVFLGDYVDRGLDSKQVVERLVRSEWPTRIIALAGNHEDLLMAFLDDEGVLEAWRSLGGLETIHSYGVNFGPAMAKRDFGAVRAAFAAHFPERHRAFLEGLNTSVAIGDYFFCHAGVRPGVPLARQAREDLLTIRDPFLSSEAEHGKLVVHGHTPSLVPEIRAYSPNMPAWMSGTEGNWYFDFPSQDGVHYVYKVAPAVTVGRTIRMRFVITGNGAVVPTEGTATARVRLFLQQRGDTLTAQEPYKRWWSVTYVELHQGEFTLSASLSPEEWTSVFGQGGAEVPNEFNAAISQLANVGFTFGGTFAGHGVYVTGGNARFILKEYSVSL